MSGFPLTIVALVLLYSIHHDLTTDPVKEAAKANAKAAELARRKRLARDVEITTKTDYARERRTARKRETEAD
jgi:BCCT family betaine/carnitine transporter